MWIKDAWWTPDIAILIHVIYGDVPPFFDSVVYYMQEVIRHVTKIKQSESNVSLGIYIGGYLLLRGMGQFA